MVGADHFPQERPNLTGSSPVKLFAKKLFFGPNKYLVFAAIGLAIFIASLLGTIQRERILSFSSEPPPIIQESSTAPPVHISIPSLEIDIPIESGLIINGTWTISKESATHLATSASPVGKGNIIIYGHDKKEVFGKLGQAKTGEAIHVQTSDGKTHSYQIKNIFTTTPDNVSPLLPTNEEVLTVYTCTGFFDSKRLIVQASPPA